MARTRSHLELTGLADLRDTFRKVAPKEADKAAADTVYEIAGVVEGRLFRKLREKSRTGRLALSVFRRRRATKDGIASAEVRGGATAPYLMMLEWGTSRTPAQPSITPVVEETRPELPQLYRSLFGERLAKRLRTRGGR